MSQKNIITILLSLTTGTLGALVVCSFFFYYCKPAQTAEISKPPVEQSPKPPVEQSPTPPGKIESQPFPQEDVKESEVDSLTIATSYKEFYAEGTKCRQNYNEYFKNTDGVSSSSSPCNIKMTFNRDGSAEREIEVRRYDTKERKWQVVEKTVWKSKVSSDQFKELAKIVVNNSAFKDWNDNIMINVSNCRITAKYGDKSKSPMSNVGPVATAYLPMVEAFKQIEAKVDWEKM